MISSKNLNRPADPFGFQSIRSAIISLPARSGDLAVCRDRDSGARQHNSGRKAGHTYLDVVDIVPTIRWITTNRDLFPFPGTPDTPKSFHHY